MLRLTTGFFCLRLFLIWIVRCNISAFGRKSFSVARPLGISESYIYFLYKKTTTKNPADAAEAWNAQCTGGKSTIRVQTVFAVLMSCQLKAMFVVFLSSGRRGVDDG